MLEKRQALKVGVIGAAMTLLATPAFARSIELKGAGTTLWIFLIIGAIIVLLQLIPAGILFNFIGRYSGPEEREEGGGEVVLPGAEPGRK
jgi:hypothetical protein